MSFNTRSPAVKRIMREAQELKEVNELFYAQPSEDNIFDWHFTIRGPQGSDFEGGIYHGRILLPTEYPMRPPDITFLTPNGRFKVNEKICLTITGHHENCWTASWSIRTALLALIGFMPTFGEGALGSLDYTTEERKILAKKSLSYKCPVCNIENSHVLPKLTEKSQSIQEEAKELATQINFKDGKPATDKEETRPIEQPQQQQQALVTSNTENQIRQRPITSSEPVIIASTSSTSQPPRNNSTPQQQQHQQQHNLISTNNNSSFNALLIIILCFLFAFLFFRRLLNSFNSESISF